MKNYYNTIGAKQYDTPQQLQLAAQKKADQIIRAKAVLTDPVKKRHLDNDLFLLGLARIAVGVVRFLITAVVWVLLVMLAFMVMGVLTMTGMSFDIAYIVIILSVIALSYLSVFNKDYHKLVIKLKSLIPYPEKPINPYTLIKADKNIHPSLIPAQIEVAAKEIDLTYRSLLDSAFRKQHDKQIKARRLNKANMIATFGLILVAGFIASIA